MTNSVALNRIEPMAESDYDLLAADLFCGAGGGTTGMLQACEELNLRVKVLAVNHWPVAIDTHSVNHADVEHLCENLDAVWPRMVVRGGKLHFALFAPECPHHSKARGAKPRNEQSRATAWHVIRWCEELDIENVLVENVPEFVEWGPLFPSDHPDEKKRDKPDPKRKGEYFREWLRALRRRGYKVEWKVLNSAYFGAATARPRFFLQAKKKGKITWPKPTHAPRVAVQPSLFGDEKPFRGAHEIIDWDVPGESIFDRKKPLCWNTLRRIFVGVEKMCLLPFIVPYYSEREGQAPRIHSLQDPFPTICAQQRHALCRPFLVVLRNNCDVLPLDVPVPTICAARNHFYFAQPTLTPWLTWYNGGKDARSLQEPLPTVTANYDHFAFTQPILNPCLVSYKGNDTVKSLSEPLGTLTSHDRFALMNPFLFSMEHTTVESGDARRCHELGKPLPTVTNRAAFGFINPFLLPPEGVHRGNAPRSVETPLQTITAARGGGHLLNPFLVRYNGTGAVESLERPLPTLTARDRFGLVFPHLLPQVIEQYDGNVEIVAVLDILYRMLQKHELSAAMGFPKTYIFKGNDSQVKRQIGNAIEVNMARELVKEMLLPYAKASRRRVTRKVSSGKTSVKATVTPVVCA